MNRLIALFEEDLQMQDALNDSEYTDNDSEDFIISILGEKIAKEEEKDHLFTNEDDDTRLFNKEVIKDTKRLDKYIDDDDDIDDGVVDEDIDYTDYDI